MKHYSPMRTSGTQHLIERTYRESGVFQWVRETVVNAIEAGATEIEFGIEWQAVANRSVYRRVIADNGRGMSAEELVAFFNTFGGGGKPIGGAHENFGVGSKTSLLPWNRYGVVVISWVDGVASMIWVQRDPASGEYGLVRQICTGADGEQTLEDVYTPFADEEHGCDWRTVKPSIIKDHGTVVILMGNSATDDTVTGDHAKEESDIKGISSYLNRRLWQIPEGLSVVVDELRHKDRSKWPRDLSEAHGPAPKGGEDHRTNSRTVMGAEHHIAYKQRGFSAGELKGRGKVAVSDGTVVEWFLWKGERPGVQSYAAIGGYIATLYKNELYDLTTHHSTYRSFGIGDASVRKNVWLIVHPTPFDDTTKRGVYPRTDRNALLIQGGPNAGGPLPIHSWAAEFADQMPSMLREALQEARSDGDGTMADNRWRDRLAERFGSRWRVSKLRAASSGTHSITPNQPGSTSGGLGEPGPRPPPPPRPPGPQPGDHEPRPGSPNTLGQPTGPQPAIKRSVPGGIPHYRFARASDFGAGMMAAWQPKDPEHPEGVVLLNVEHPVLTRIVEHWQAQLPAHWEEDVRTEVLSLYGEVAVAKVAHSEHLASLLPRSVIDAELRSEAALTMALLGLFAEDAVLATRIGGKFGKRKAV